MLENIAAKEGIIISGEALKTLARRDGGDVRAALNDLEILSTAKDITLHTLDELGMREREDTIIDALLKILKTTDPKTAIDAFEHVGEDADQQMLWLDENIPREYQKPEELARAYDSLSKADIFNRRIRRWQHWRFLVYVNALLTAGVAVAKDAKNSAFVPYKPTGRILKIWMANQRNAKKKGIAEKIASHTHTSAKEAVKHVPLYKAMLKGKAGEMLAAELRLDEEEREWVGKA